MEGRKGLGDRQAELRVLNQPELHSEILYQTERKGVGMRERRGEEKNQLHNKVDF